MEFYPDGINMSLRSHVYLHADERGTGASLRHAAAWLVHRLACDGAAYFILHAAANVQYPALSPVQRQDQNDDAREAIRAGDGDEGVLLRSTNARCRPWYAGFTCDDVENASSVIDWMVEAIPTRPAPPVIGGPTQYNGGGSFGGLHTGPMV